MTNLRLSRAQLEKAFVAFLMTKLQGTKWYQVPVQARMGAIEPSTGKFALDKLDEIPLPCIAVAAPTAKRHAMGFSECELHIIVLGAQDPDPENGKTDPLNDHAELVGEVAGWIGEDQLPTVMAAINAPDSGTDTRAIKDFRLFGYLPQDESSQETDRAFIDDFVYLTHSQPTDDTSL